MTLDSTAKPWIKTASYEGPERRVYSKTPEQLEEDIRQMFRDHEVQEKTWIDGLRKEFMSAFPNEDARGHCDAHEAMIKAKQAEEAFWKAAREEGAKQGVAGFFAVLKVVFVLALIGLGFKLGFGPVIAKLLGVTVSE